MIVDGLLPIAYLPPLSWLGALKLFRRAEYAVCRS